MLIIKRLCSHIGALVLSVLFGEIGIQSDVLANLNGRRNYYLFKRDILSNIMHVACTHKPKQID